MEVDKEIERVKICSKCLKRAKKYGTVKADDGAILSRSIVKVVDWAGRAKAKREKLKVKSETKKLEVEDEKEVKKKAEVSIEELVGSKKT